MEEMEEAPKAVRFKDQEKIYRTRTDDSSIEPDRVSPSIEGYFRIPAVWVGEQPSEEDIKTFTKEVYHEIVFQKTLRCGIQVAVQRDGLFLFDFTGWPSAPQIEIPGFTRPEVPYRKPDETAVAEEKAEEYAVLRAQLMNAHQACLTTAEALVKSRGAMMGFPVTAWNTVKAISLKSGFPYRDDVEDVNALARNVMNNSYGIQRQRPLGRRTLEIEVIDASFEILDRILEAGDVKLILLVEAAYIAACRVREKRAGEAVVLAWGVCEQLVSVMWLQSQKEIATLEPDKMPGERKKKLNSRDYTASVKVEILELLGKIDHELYRILEIGRKSRNKWAHEMRVPKESEARVCIRAIESLFAIMYGVNLKLQSGGRGGVPQWPVWMRDAIRASAS